LSWMCGKFKLHVWPRLALNSGSSFLTHWSTGTKARAHMPGFPYFLVCMAVLPVNLSLRFSVFHNEMETARRPDSPSCPYMGTDMNRAVAIGCVSPLKPNVSMSVEYQVEYE
jgi:hypothetical protein